MGEIIFIDKAKADALEALGFKYTERNIDGKQTFVFIQTNELMKELNQNFDKGSFFIAKNVCL